MEKNLDILSKNLFDVSLLEVKSLSDEEFKNYILNHLQEILNKEFAGIMQKRRIKVCRDRLQFACPCCHDSASDLSKKRGNIILTGKFAGMFKCFNCGSFMPVNKFFDKFNVKLSPDSIDYINSHKSDLDSYNGISINASTNINYLFDPEEIERYTISKDFLIKNFGLITCSSSDMHIGAKYLKSRHLTNFDNYLYDPVRDLLFIFNLTTKGSILGFQIRRLRPKKGEPKYMTYSTKSIYKFFLRKENVEIPDSIDILSMMFNIFTIDLNKPILVTEGPIDSYFLPNCIATTGANKSIQLDLPYWFVYDSDKTGIEHAIEKINQGYHVFLWDKLKKEYGLPNRAKWDISDFIDWCIQNKKQIPRTWQQYFSQDSWDLLDI